MTTSTPTEPEPQRTSGNSLARHLREVLMLLAIVGLIACNVATVVSSAFADALHGAVSAVAGVASAKLAERLLSSSPKVRQVKAIEAATTEMRVKSAAQEVRFKDLEVQHTTLQGQHKAAVASKAAHIKNTKVAASSIRVRLARGTARRVAALPSEAAPAVGLAIVIGMAAYDIYDACETLKELNGLLQAAEQPLEDVSMVCGVKVPAYREVVESAVKNWREAVAKSKTVLGDLEGKVTIPEVRIPTAGDVMRVTCPVLAIPRLCTK